MPTLKILSKTVIGFAVGNALWKDQMTLTTASTADTYIPGNHF